jgi:hypothetical protein
VGEPGYQFIYLYRDLRDQLVSLTHHLKYYESDPATRPIHDVMKKFSDSEVLSMLISGFSVPVASGYLGMASISDQARVVLDWVEAARLNPNVITLRFEALLKDTLVELRRLADFLGVNVDDSRLMEIVDAHCFESVTGRTAGEERRESGHRKGVVGDWKKHFEPIHVQLIKKHAGHALVKLGYERDLHW